MDFSITDATRFDDNKRLFSEQRLSIPRNRLKPDFSLDTTLAYHLTAQYFTVLERSSRPLVKVEVNPEGIQVNVRGVGTALRFGVGEPEVTETRAAIHWPIIGGRALARDADSGGTYTIGAEWDERRENLVLFAKVENYTPLLTGRSAPRLRRLLYSRTQQPVHLFFTHRFLAEAARELTRTET